MIQTVLGSLMREAQPRLLQVVNLLKKGTPKRRQYRQLITCRRGQAELAFLTERSKPIHQQQMHRLQATMAQGTRQSMLEVCRVRVQNKEKPAVLSMGLQHRGQWTRRSIQRCRSKRS